MTATNETHDPALRCWAPGAEDPADDFPIQNLPFGVFRRRGTSEDPRGGVAIGAGIVDLATCLRDGLLHSLAAEAAAACAGPRLNPLLALGPAHWSALRLALSRLLRGARPPAGAEPARLLVPLAEAELVMPITVGDYTDFFASIDHAAHAGALVRPDLPLPPSYRHLPIAYHGRASTIVVSGTPCRRPRGQVMRRGAEAPAFELTRSLDYELELAAVIGPGNIGPGNAVGDPIPLARAEQHIFGLCLLNDWSARDIQSWEQRPLGPFLGKSFLTTIAPWIVTLEALAPFRVPARPRGADDPPLLAYLDAPQDRAHGGVDIAVEAALQSPQMRERDLPPMMLNRNQFRSMYWTLFQLLAHHASNGCAFNAGDLIASGTISGPDSAGCLLELTEGGKKRIALPSGEERRFLEDGDEVILGASCRRDGFARIGFGQCRGRVAPAA